MRFTKIILELLKDRIDDQFTAMNVMLVQPGKEDERTARRRKTECLQIIEHLISVKHTSSLSVILTRFEHYDESIKEEFLNLIVSRLDFEAAHSEEVA